MSSVSTEMTQSPLQFKLGHKMLVDVIKSSKSDILQVYDNLTIYPEDGKSFQFDLKEDHPSES